MIACCAGIRLLRRECTCVVTIDCDVPRPLSPKVVCTAIEEARLAGIAFVPIAKDTLRLVSPKLDCFVPGLLCVASVAPPRFAEITAKLHPFL